MTKGVIIPHANIKNLALKPDVVNAIEAGTFSIYGVKKVEQALYLLTERNVGEENDEHIYQPDSINHDVVNRLRKIAEMALNGKNDNRNKGQPNNAD